MRGTDVTLRSIDCRVMRLRYGIDGESMTYADIAALIGVSIARVQQRHARAMCVYWKYVSDSRAHTNDQSSIDVFDRLDRYRHSTGIPTTIREIRAANDDTRARS